MNLQYSITISTDTYLQEASENALQQPGRKQEVLRFTTSLPLLVSVKVPPSEGDYQTIAIFRDGCKLLDTFIKKSHSEDNRLKAKLLYIATGLI